MEIELAPENYKLGVTLPSPKDDFTRNLDRSISGIAKNEGFIKPDIYKRSISTNGGNYLGELFEIDVKGKTKAGEKEINLFIKHITNADTIKILSVYDAYKTELFAYQELSKIFEEVQEEANIPIDERYKMVKIYEGTNKDMMVMENMAKKGFTTYDRMDVVSLNFLQVCFRNIAKFHALSFALKKERPEFFENKIKCLEHPYLFNEEFQRLIDSLADITLNNIDDDMKDKAEKSYKNLMAILEGYCTDKSLKVCLSHADYRANNILMKVQGDEVQEVITVDYQLLHFGCPVFDLLFLLYISTDRETRKNHMSELKNLYYESFRNFLNYFNIDSNEVYPRIEFEKVFQEKHDFGLAAALYFLPFMFAADVPDIPENCDIKFAVDDRFKERMRGVLEDFVELGFI